MAKKHSKLGASGCSRWLACPGSVALEARFPDKPSVYAQEGTAAHRLGEKALLVMAKEKELMDGHMLADNLIQQHVGKPLLLDDGSSHLVTEEMATAVGLYLDTVASYLANWDNAVLSVEQKLHLDWLHDDLWGTADAVIQDGEGMAVIDYKHGQGVTVEVENNPQLMFYALGALGLEGNEDVKNVDIVVVQPRGMGDPVKVWNTTAEYLRHWGTNVLLPGAKAARKKNAPLHAGDHCKFCRAAGSCPEQAKGALATCGFKVEDLSGKKELPPVHLLSPEEISRVLVLAPTFRSWIDDIQDRALQELQAGNPIPGWKVVAGRSNRQWINDTEAEMALELEMGDVILTEPKLKSPAQIEATAKTLGHKINIDGLTHQPPGKPTLVPVTDSRPALVGHSAEDVFKKEDTHGQK